MRSENGRNVAGSEHRALLARAVVEFEIESELSRRSIVLQQNLIGHADDFEL